MLSSNQINDILELSQVAFGDSYLTYEVLQGFIRNTNCEILLEEEQGKVIGFTIVLVVPKKERTKHLFLSPHWFKKHLNTQSEFGYRKMTVVRKENQKMGIGKSLVYRGDKYLISRCTQILSTVWKNGKERKMKELLTSSGYTELETISNYWAMDSENNNYNCQFCGEPPCSCSAIVFLKDVNR